MKANNTLNLLRRNMGACPRVVKERCYKSLVRPVLEYSSIVWGPFRKQNIDKIEMVEKRAATFVFGNYNCGANPTAMITELGWQSLAECRTKAKAMMIFKIQHCLTAIPQSLFQQYPQHLVKQICHSSCRTNCYKFLFIPTAIKISNSFPSTIRSSHSLDTFKSSIENITLSNYY